MLTNVKLLARSLVILEVRKHANCLFGCTVSVKWRILARCFGRWQQNVFVRTQESEFEAPLNISEILCSGDACLSAMVCFEFLSRVISYTVGIPDPCEPATTNLAPFSCSGVPSILPCTHRYLLWFYLMRCGLIEPVSCCFMLYSLSPELHI